MSKKKHADFQSKYHQSKNFMSITEDESLKVAGEGKVKLTTQKTLSQDEKDTIANAMDSMRERIEITPGGEQTDRSRQNE